MHLEQNLAIGISVSLAAVSLVLELMFDYTDILSRSGPLIVCVGVYFGIIGVNNFFVNQVSELNSNRSEIDIVHNDDELAGNVRGSTNYLFGKIQKIAKGRVGLVETHIVAAGTLIWSFGDLI
jgi:L-lactate permease